MPICHAHQQKGELWIQTIPDKGPSSPAEKYVPSAAATTPAEPAVPASAPAPAAPAAKAPAVTPAAPTSAVAAPAAPVVVAAPVAPVPAVAQPEKTPQSVVELALALRESLIRIEAALGVSGGNE